MTLERMKTEAGGGYESWSITVLEDYLEYLRSCSNEPGHIFRGQSQTWPLLPKIGRFARLEDSDLLSVERALLEDFQREAVSFLQLPPANAWDWLAVAQHHGLPTRLLDWTSNPLAALWFVVRDVPESENEFLGVVWDFKPARVDQVERLDGKETPFDGTRTKVFLPRHITPRIRAQDGLFTAHKYFADRGQFVPLEKNKAYRTKLRQVLVPSRYFPDIRWELDRCGIHEASLFPDLDGLTRRLQYRHIWKDDEG